RAGGRRPPRARPRGARWARARRGPAAAAACRGARGPRRVLIGRDTRESGEWMTEALAEGVAGAAAGPVDAGVLSTPAVSFLTRDGGYDAGLVVSASHNPYQDNGVKVFTAGGEKAGADLEARITASVAEPDPVPPAGSSPVERVSIAEAYLDHTAGILRGVEVPAAFRMAIDCANGATSRLAPAVLRRLGLAPVVLHDRPDGRNINRGCGSMHPASLGRAVVEQGCDLGAAFDGDGDRVVLVDHRGLAVPGDAVLLVAARWLAARGRLPHRGVVATVMSNIALEQALAAEGVTLHRCAVGDRLVREEMRRRGLALGGEQSGHVIFGDHLPTGDGLATALMILRAMLDSGRPLADLAADLALRPQVLLNVEVRRRARLDELPGVSALVEAAAGDLGRDGRVLVRYSGTEPLLRIMIEGPDEARIRGLAEAIAERVRAEIGVGPGVRG
ncbi:MAG: phosphoglucosamine mutase, partial [Acidobacteria bacterium]|nr:phosphoglucosamine mutase [Acidobacteriota bacterium]